MGFPPQFLDELRARLPVSEVVGRRVKLKKAGREWKGLSPFNKEKTPSFTVNDQKGFYHDFSSGKHGDIFGFVMETEGVTFPEAVERLANMAGLPVPKFSREEEARDVRRKTLHDVMEIAADRPDWRTRIAPDSPVIGAELILAARKEMAPTLADIVIRRTPLGALGYPGDGPVARAAAIVGKERKWSEDRVRDEIESVKRFYFAAALTAP